MLVRPHGTQVATMDFQEQDVPIRSCTGGSSTTLNQFHLRPFVAQTFVAQTNAFFEIESYPSLPSQAGSLGPRLCPKLIRLAPIRPGN